MGEECYCGCLESRCPDQCVRYERVGGFGIAPLATDQSQLHARWHSCVLDENDAFLPGILVGRSDLREQAHRASITGGAERYDCGSLRTAGCADGASEYVLIVIALATFDTGLTALMRYRCGCIIRSSIFGHCNQEEDLDCCVPRNGNSMHFAKPQRIGHCTWQNHF